MEKHSVSRLSHLFAHLHLLSSDSFSSTLLSSNLSLLSDPFHLCFSSVHIVGSLTSKLPSISTPMGRESQPGPGSLGFMLHADPSQAQESMLEALELHRCQCQWLLGKYLKGHNSGENVPKKSKGEKGPKPTQPYETIVNQLSSPVEQIKSASKSKSPSRKASSSGSSSWWRRKSRGITRWFKCISPLIVVK